MSDNNTAKGKAAKLVADPADNDMEGDDIQIDLVPPPPQPSREPSVRRLEVLRPSLRRHAFVRCRSSMDLADETELMDAACTIQCILTKALVRVGVTAGDECSKRADAITASLAELYILTPDQLVDALALPEVLEQVTGCINGMLLPAVRSELEKRSNSRAKWMKLVEGINDQPSNKTTLNKPLCRKLDVARVDVTHLAEIDQITQTFYARLLLVLRIKGGANDPDLTSEYEGFPFDEEGRPTFRPSGLWYLGQIDFPNGKEVKTVESKVTKRGDDLHLLVRIEGQFFQRFELRNFPFDRQELTITVSANCACEGPVPVEFGVGGSSQLGVDTINFPHGDIWELAQAMSASLGTVGASSSRRFPAVHLRAHVRRRCSFVMINAAIPVSVISFLSLTTFFVPPEDTADRLELSITTLLTVVAFKYTTSSYLPQISYMTLVDKFTVLGTLIIAIVCLGHTTLGMLDSWVEVPSDTLVFLNKIFFAVIVIAWVGVQLWFLHMARRVRDHSILRRRSLAKQPGLKRLPTDQALHVE